MFDNEVLSHHIERKIIHALMFTEYARFTDLRPKGVDSNLFSYHLKSLIARGYIAKTDRGYTLSHKGMQYVDRVSTAGMKPRTQPKIITMLFIQGADGKILLQQRSKQPYINTWTLPYGKLHIEDETLHAATIREATEKIGTAPTAVTHHGDCYIRVMRSGAIESTTLAHIMRVTVGEVGATDTLQWVDVAALLNLRLAPAVEPIVAQCLSGEYAFEEYVHIAE